MAMCTREIGKMTSYKEKEYFRVKTERNTKEIGFKTRCRGKESVLNQTGIFTRENG
jgi:hypothetical protein